MRKKFTDCVDLAGTSCKNFSGTKRYISTGAIDENHINENNVEIIDFSGKPSRANLVVLAGDAIFAKMQATKKTLLIDDELAECIYSTGFYAVHAKKNVIKEKCLFYLLTSDAFLKQKDKNCSGATQKAITNTGLKKIIVNIPDYKHQDEVVEKLDAVSRIISLYQNELKCFDELVKARFVEIFGDPVCNTFNWPKIELGKQCEITTGNTPSRAESENYGTFIEWIKSDNINTPSTFLTVAQEYLSEIGFQKCRFVESGSLLMTCIAGSLNCIGNVAITDRRVAFNQQINAITPKYDNVLYLYWLIILSKPIIHRTINMALKGILSKSQLSSIEFPFPPLSLQNQFASFVTQVDKSKSAVQKSLDEAQLLFDSLMQQYFE
ncbi:restriction endonuclease subunit S [Gemmiger sp.]|uniref:restriction endonuclease subunit S n=1 Tax=Gemmiger sp. TaxID=2049027 RepID=UPI003AB2B6F4